MTATACSRSPLQHTLLHAAAAGTTPIKHHVCRYVYMFIPPRGHSHTQPPTHIHCYQALSFINVFICVYTYIYLHVYTYIYMYCLATHPHPTRHAINPEQRTAHRRLRTGIHLLSLLRSATERPLVTITATAACCSVFRCIETCIAVRIFLRKI